LKHSRLVGRGSYEKAEKIGDPGLEKPFLHHREEERSYNSQVPAYERPRGGGMVGGESATHPDSEKALEEPTFRK